MSSKHLTVLVSFQWILLCYYQYSRLVNQLLVSLILFYKSFYFGHCYQAKSYSHCKFSCPFFNHFHLSIEHPYDLKSKYFTLKMSHLVHFSELKEVLTPDCKVLRDPNDLNFAEYLKRWTDIGLKTPGAIVLPTSESDCQNIVRIQSIRALITP